MLSAADNEVLTRTGAGTPMGELFRRFWLPVLLSQEVAEPDGPPVRVTLLGENLVAFRDTEGRVGLLDPRCQHRGADLFFGRNEACGLRCAYHGWKYDVTGRCVELPTLPAESRFKDGIRVTSYPTREWGDFVWAYLGPPERMPALPELEFALLPPAHRFVSKKLQQCNWAQSCEGGLDTAHFSFLHMPVAGAADPDSVIRRSSVDADRTRWMREDPMPQFHITPHAAGLAIGASRRADGHDLYWRISQFLLPNHGFAPNALPGEHYHGQTWVPITDQLCWVYCYTWNPERPLDDAERTRLRGGASIHAQVDERWVPLRNRANDYLIDRVDQKLRTFTGIEGVSEQDACIQDSQGVIADRTREHLGPTDAGIIQFRRLVLGAARALQAGAEPAAAHDGAAYAVRSGSIVADASLPFPEVMRTRFGDPVGRVARTGENAVRA